MTDEHSVQAGLDKTTENYHVFNSAQDEIVGMYVHNEAAERLDSDFIEVTVTEDDGTGATLDKTTSNYGVYSTPGGGISGIYVEHDILQDLVGAEGEDYEAPESVGLSLAESDEDSFEQATLDEEEIESLVGSDDSEEAEDEGEEVEVEDEAIGLVDGE